MNRPAPDSAVLRERLAAPLATLQESTTASRQDPAPAQIAEAFGQLLDAMKRTEASFGTANPARAQDVSELGEYAIELFNQALQQAEQSGLADIHAALQSALVDTARWVAANGGQLLSLESIVDAVARLANQTREPGELLSLYQTMGEIMDATSAVIREDLEKTNPGRPWRILNMNRAIVATRTHQPDVMEEAFELLSRRFPEDAPGFFTQGMEQMDLLNYPAHVREVMNRYYRKWSADRSLH